MAALANESRPYRPCVGLMVFNAAGKVFVGNRVDVEGDHWQMPQGGIDDGESPRDAAMRELREEIGTDKAEILAESRDWRSYDLPRDISRIVWGGKYRGQTQLWFALRFTGQDDDINLDAHHTEFADWRWVDIENLADLIIPFKRQVYQSVVDEFRSFARPRRTVAEC